MEKILEAESLGTGRGHQGMMPGGGDLRGKT